MVREAIAAILVITVMIAAAISFHPALRFRLGAVLVTARHLA